MRENLHRFFRAARGAGVRLSPAESIDAMRAVSKVGFADRTILRDTFLLTLAKTQDEKKALGDCFDLFFDQPEPQSPPEDGKSDEQDQSGSNAASDSPGDASGGDEQADGLGQLAQMLLAQDRNQISAAIANAASAASLSDIRYFTQRGIFSGRILDQMGIERLRDDLDNLDRDQSGAGGTADQRAGRAARHGARNRLAGADAVRARGSRKPAQRNSCATRRCRGSSRGRSSRCGG